MELSLCSVLKIPYFFRPLALRIAAAQAPPFVALSLPLELMNVNPVPPFSRP